jgi:hypothetical protein
VLRAHPIPCHGGTIDRTLADFGVLIDNLNLAETVERELRQAEDLLFERVTS